MKWELFIHICSNQSAVTFHNIKSIFRLDFFPMTHCVRPTLYLTDRQYLYQSAQNYSHARLQMSEPPCQLGFFSDLYFNTSQMSKPAEGPRQSYRCIFTLPAPERIFTCTIGAQIGNVLQQNQRPTLFCSTSLTQTNFSTNVSVARQQGRVEEVMSKELF